MSNQISFLGRLGADPELKDVGETQVLEFRVASDVNYGERKSTNWFRCAYWGKRGAGIQPHISKGSMVYIVGELTLREWTDKEGATKISPDVRVDRLDFAGGKKESQDDEGPF